MFARFFIDRPVLSNVIAILTVLLGLVAYVRLPVEQYPDLAPPIVRVEAFYPGANAQTIADTVAAPLEQEINGVDHMIYMQSTSSDGRYGLDVSFEVGTDIDLSSILVQNRVSIAQPKLPEEVRRLGVTVRKQSTNLAGVLNISADNGPDGKPLYDDLFLSNYATINWRDEFARIFGVGGITILPAKDYGMRIWLDPARLKARGIAVNDVTAALRAQNVQVAAGKIGAAPSPEDNPLELLISTKGRLSDPHEFGEVIIKAPPPQRRDDIAQVVRVRDVARIELGARDYGTAAAYNGRPGAFLILYQLPGANLVEVTDAIRAKMAELEPRLPPGVRSAFVYDSSMFIRASLKEVLKTLVEAFLLVSLVVLVFLQNLRATLIPVTTIPVSLIGTFLLMWALGYSVNMLTMFGLVLAIGIVVDDAIVVVENVERNMREKRLKPREATIQAMGEIIGPIIGITLVLMSVFLPTAALPGITGEMYRQFAITIAVTTLLSAINALTLKPTQSALWLKAHDDHTRGWAILAPLRWAAWLFNQVFAAITHAYAGTARFAIRAWPLTVLLFGGVLYLTYFIYVRVPGGFVPNEDLGFVVVAAQLPDGASLNRTSVVADRVRALIQPVRDAQGRLLSGVDGVADVSTMSGFSLIDGSGANLANAWIVLEPWDVRERKHRSVEAILADVNARVQPIQEANFLVFTLPAIPGIGNAAAIDMRLLDRGNQGRAALEQAAYAAMGAMMGQQPPKIAFAFSSFRAGVPQLYLDIDRERLIRMDVNLQSVFETLGTYLGSAYVNDFNWYGRTWQVNLQADAPFRLRPDDALRLEVRSGRGEMVPLGAAVKVKDGFGPDRVTRYNMYPSATINGIPVPGVSSSEAMDTMAAAARTAIGPEMGYEWSGLSYQESKLGNQGLLAFVLATVLVYLILAAQYESFFTPVAVVLSVPLVIIGAMIALWLSDLDNNVFTQIGLVLLVALGAKNAILIVEFARDHRRQGMPIVEAAVSAARTRFRPIIMTSLAFILGVLPLVTAHGAGAAGRQALGTVVFGGMIGVTVLGLYFTPALYVMVQWVAEKFGTRREKHASAGSPLPTPAAGAQ